MRLAPDINNIPLGKAADGLLAIGGRLVEGGWRYRERSAQGESIGTLVRRDNPAEGQPRCMWSKRGLIFHADGCAPVWARAGAIRLSSPRARATQQPVHIHL